MATAGALRSPVTVLHVAQPTEAGVGRYVRDLVADQAARGWGVVVACPDRGRLADELTRLGIPRADWPAVRAPDGRTLAEAVRLRRIVDRIAPDVVHLHSSKAGLAGRLAVRGRRPTLFQPHGWSWLAAGRATAAACRRWERFAGRWTSLTLCVGDGEAELARRHGLAGPSTVVRSGVDLDRFPPASDVDRCAARDRLGLPAGAPLAVCIGRITRQKGQDLLAAAWPAVRARHPSAGLALVGEGSPLVDTPPGVRATGPTVDPWSWYAAADVVVLPSRWEGMPLTLLEAMAVGRSIVASDIAGIAGVLPAGAGLLVPVGDVAALAAAVASRLGDPDLAAREGGTGRAYAQTADIRHTHDRIAALTGATLTGATLTGATLTGATLSGPDPFHRDHEVCRAQTRAVSSVQCN